MNKNELPERDLAKAGAGHDTNNTTTMPKSAQKMSLRDHVSDSANKDLYTGLNKIGEGYVFSYLPISTKPYQVRHQYK